MLVSLEPQDHKDLQVLVVNLDLPVHLEHQGYKGHPDRVDQAVRLELLAILDRLDRLARPDLPDNLGQTGSLVHQDFLARLALLGQRVELEIPGMPDLLDQRVPRVVLATLAHLEARVHKASQELLEPWEAMARQVFRVLQVFRDNKGAADSMATQEFLVLQEQMVLQVRVVFQDLWEYRVAKALLERRGQPDRKVHLVHRD